MRQISGIKRLTLGLGIMALGVVGALPFRHAAPPEPAGGDQTAWNPVTLGEGVSLQVPGQAAVGRAQLPEVQPTPSDDEPDERILESSTTTSMAHASPPPQLPDQYRPLFRSDAGRQGSAGHVIGSRPEAEPARKGPKKHRIRDGDTLDSLALRYLGDRDRADEILQANRDVLTEPDVLPIGVQIRIPRSAPEASGPDSEDDQPHLVPLPAVNLGP